MVSKRLLIPFRGLENPKTRLCAVLDIRERRALALNILLHVLSIARRMFSKDEILVLTRSEDLSLSVPMQVAGPNETDLNAELIKAISRYSRDDLIVATHADLPNLSVGDLQSLIACAPDEILIAPDRLQAGTNALAFRSGQRFLPSFGKDSYHAHVRAAQSLGVTWRSLRRDGLAQDIDTPKHLADVPDTFLDVSSTVPKANLIT